MKESDFEVIRFEDLIKWVLKNKKERYTDFLNLSSQKLLEKIIFPYKEIEYLFDGGFERAERKIAIIYPNFISPKEVPISALRIMGNLERLSHRDILGALLGLGIKRDKTGDIVLKDNVCDIIIHKDVESFVLMNLNKIGRENIKISSIKLSDIMQPEIKYKDIFSTVASLRLDSITASGFNISRSKASQLIKSGSANVNWEYKDDPSYQIKENDIISLRGFGRIELKEVKGITKKGRISIHICRFI